MEAERGRLQARICKLSQLWCDTSERLAGLWSTRAHIDSTHHRRDGHGLRAGTDSEQR